MFKWHSEIAVKPNSEIYACVYGTMKTCSKSVSETIATARKTDKLLESV